MKDEGASNDDDPTLRIYSAEVLAVLLTRTLIAATINSGITTAIISTTTTTTIAAYLLHLVVSGHAKGVSRALPNSSARREFRFQRLSLPPSLGYDQQT